MHQDSRYQDIVESVKGSIWKHNVKLREINQQIWSNPELGFEERIAHDSICAMFDALSAEGYAVRRKTFGLETSFEIEYSNGVGGRVIAFNAEYDALPGIGHACGHNLIATSSIAAFIATVETMKEMCDSENGPAYTVRLLGTPAEENGGGKVHMINAGAYRDVDACLMVHPAGAMNQMKDMGVHGIAAPPTGAFLANQKLTVTFTGRPAHASSAPWEGINALDAAVTAYVNISVLRQQIQPTQRIHGIITHGGERPNIIPTSTTMVYDIRDLNRKNIQILVEKVKGCFDAAATATGCQVEYKWNEKYLDLQSNMAICEKYVTAMKALGRNIWLGGEKTPTTAGASTDQGNVSYVTPSFHGIFVIPTEGGAQPHTAEFSSYAGKPEALSSCLDSAAGMAVVAYQVLTDTDLAALIKEEFVKID